MRRSAFNNSSKPKILNKPENIHDEELQNFSWMKIYVIKCERRIMLFYSARINSLGKNLVEFPQSFKLLKIL